MTADDGRDTHRLGQGDPPGRVLHIDIGFWSPIRQATGKWSRHTSEVRMLFVFDPWRSAILLVAGDKAGNWQKWYLEAIPRAEHLYEIYLKERAEEEGTP